MTEHQSTKIDELSRQHRNLRKEIFRYFDEGCSAAMVAEILQEKHQANISEKALRRFRIGTWVPYRQALEQKRITKLAATAVARQQTMRNARATRNAGDKR